MGLELLDGSASSLSQGPTGEGSMSDRHVQFELRRRQLLQGAAAGAALLSPLSALAAAGDMDAVRKAVEGAHDANVKRLRDWIALPSIAAENRNVEEGCRYMMELARDAGF